MATKRVISAVAIAAILALTAQPAFAGISISACFGSSRHGHSSSSHGRIVHGSSHGRVLHGSIGHHGHSSIAHSRISHPIISRYHGCSPHISSRIHCYPHTYSYHHKSIVYHHPHIYHSRYSSICAPRHNIIITTPPVVCKPAPVVKVVESKTITVWFTNTNGSKSSITLTKSGPGFIGPKSEYYKTMPTDEQLRMVYGF